ncbi:unnamed protein product [Brachionus calyciflorus]|uniref:RING-type domain-containing protein n=1 Tax=Brachionus calyciflorus TaxID=104777 RepID=A0A814JHZ0_9BILA|nr:unnamed protein product [Brachionus calyciflorus]
MDDDESFICCPICSGQFVYPRVLPCGESICLACIKANTNEKVYNCKFCNKHHDVPNEGFPENRHLYKLIQSLESKLYRGPLYQEIRLSLNNIEEIIRDVSQDLNNGKHEIHEYCLKLINEIDLNTEKLINKINISRESLVSQVLNFEKESLDNFDMNSKSIKNHQSTLNESRNLVEVEKNFLKSLNLDEEKLKDKISRVKTAEWRLHSEKRKLKNTLFKNFDLNFIPNKLWLQVGRIEKVNNLEIDLKKFREIDLEKLFSSKPDRYHTIEVEKMDNGNFVFFYLEQSSKNWIVEIHSFEEDRTFFRCLKEVTGEYLNYSRIKAFKNRIVIYTCFKNSRILRICDENLKSLVCKSCPYH